MSARPKSSPKNVPARRNSHSTPCLRGSDEPRPPAEIIERDGVIYVEGELYVSRVTSGCRRCPYVAFLLLGEDWGSSSGNLDSQKATDPVGDGGGTKTKHDLPGSRHPETAPCHQGNSVLPSNYPGIGPHLHDSSYSHPLVSSHSILNGILNTPESNDGTPLLVSPRIFMETGFLPL